VSCPPVALISFSSAESCGWRVDLLLRRDVENLQGLGDTLAERLLDFLAGRLDPPADLALPSRMIGELYPPARPPPARYRRFCSLRASSWSVSTVSPTRSMFFSISLGSWLALARALVLAIGNPPVSWMNRASLGLITHCVISGNPFLESGATHRNTT
jgi:hypothetical protein